MLTSKAVGGDRVCNGPKKTEPERLVYVDDKSLTNGSAFF